MAAVKPASIATACAVVLVLCVLAACASGHRHPARGRGPGGELERRCLEEAETGRALCKRYNELNQLHCIDAGRRPGERVVLSSESGSLSHYTDSITCSAAPLDCRIARDDAYLSCRVRLEARSSEAAGDPGFLE